MPETKERKKVECPECHKLIDSRGFPNHLKSCREKAAALTTAPPLSETKSQTPEKVLQEIQDLKSQPNLSDEQKQKIDLMEKQFLNQTEEEKLDKQKEKEISDKQQNLRDKKVDLEDKKIDQQLEKFEDQSSDKISTKDLIEIKKLEAFSSKPDNSMAQMFQLQLQMQDKAHERDLELRKEISDLKSDKKNITQTMKEFTEFQEVAEKLAKKSGYTKGSSDKSAVEFIVDKGVDLLDKNLPTIMNTLKQGQQQPTITNFPQSNPTQQNLKSNHSGVEPVDLVSHRGQEAETMSSAPAPDQIENSFPQSQSMGNPEPISDEQYARTHDLSDFGAYVEDKGAVDNMDQMIGLGKFAPTSTAPSIK